MKINHAMLFLHLVGVIVWVGGMAFAWACLRPAATQLAPAQRLSLWAAVLARFFPLVWVSIGLILVSGFGMFNEIGFARAPSAWHVMMLTGGVMIVVFVSIWFQPWPRLRAAVAAADWAAGAGALDAIRQRVAFNLVLGAITVAVATFGLAY